MVVNMSHNFGEIYSKSPSEISFCVCFMSGFTKMPIIQLLEVNRNDDEFKFAEINFSRALALQIYSAHSVK